MSKCSKVFAILGSSLILLVGLAGMALSIYLFVQNKIWDQIIGNYQLTFAVLFIIISIMVILTGVLGVVGSSIDNKCLLHTEWMVLVVWSLAFIAAGVVAVLLPSQVLSGGCESTNTFGVFQLLNNRVIAASGLCTSSCQCYIANDTIRAYFALGGTNDNTKAKNSQTCPSAIPSNQDSVLAALQLAFTCTGWCNTDPLPKIFYFSNNDRAQTQPTDSCFNAFSTFFGNYGKYVYIASFCFVGLILIFVICIWVHICLLNQDLERHRFSKI